MINAFTSNNQLFRTQYGLDSGSWNVDMDRFSLLLLEPSEIYFEDFKVVYHTRPEDKIPAVHNEIPGRLKVGEYKKNNDV